ncbi:MAG: DUF294 nucleotidyltransferase-like domain-containing protein, partial [Bacteroidales bacterium]|nr:DUF294 nucleotidyltransferase-like domain-containing protein [Bacteroidales bacterium]
VIAVILSFVIRQSLFIENRRSEAAEKLRLSRQKYKSLVEASTEGTLMIINNDIIYCNLKFSNLVGYDPTQVTFMKFEDLFAVEWKKVIPCFDDPKKSLSIETKLKCSDGTEKEVIISISEIKLGDSHGYIIITKEISAQKQLVKETEHLASELQTSLLLMNQPIKHFTQEMLTCDFETTIQDAAILMTRKKQHVVFVQKQGKIIGVINANDLKDRVVAVGLDTQCTIIEIMTSPVVSISENALLYEAVLLLKSKGVSHLAINNETGKHVGVLGFSEISKMQQNSVSYLIKEVEISESVDELKAIYKRVPVLVNALIESGDKTQNITRIITSISDAIVKRLIQLGIEQQGEPPCEFAFMVMGSEGRMEQTLLTDQDNAIIFSDLTGDDLNLAFEYFQKLGTYVCGNLHKVGYKLCDGDNMAQNPKWTQPVSKWKEYFTQWINTSEPQDILDASIFFDFREVFGSAQMIEELRQHVNTAVESKSVFLYHMAQSVLKFKPPVSVFGNIVSSGSSDEQNTVNVKKLLMPIIGFIRVYSLSNAINETNSLSRLKQLYVKEVVKKSMYDELVLAYNYLMQMRFRFQTENILQDLPPNNDININKLTHIEIATLKKIFSEIGNIQTQVNFDFKIINT